MVFILALLPNSYVSEENVLNLLSLAFYGYKMGRKIIHITGPLSEEMIQGLLGGLVG